MPAFGLSAVPLPTKNRKMLPGCHAPTAAAEGEATAEPLSDATPDAGSPVDTDAAARTGLSEPLPISRRVAAAAAHTTVAAAGESPLPSAPSHDRNELLNPDAGATRAAVITGGAATTGSASSSTCVAAGVAVATESMFAASVFCDCGSGSETDSGAREVDPEFAAGKTPAGAWSRREATSGTTALECPPLPVDESFAPIFGTAVRVPGRRADPVAAPVAAESALAESPPDRAPRDGRAVDAPEAESAVDPVEPAEPVVSANATGTDAIAEPTPSATANAPTRPT